MKPRSVEQQISALRRTRGIAARFHLWLLGAAALGIVIAIIIWHPVPLMISLFLGIVGFAERRAGPNIVAALSAHDSKPSAPGEVAIHTTCWDTDTHFHATVREHGHPAWEYEFIPQGWQPEEGTYPARVWRCREGKPVLASVEAGIMIPRYAPTPVQERHGVASGG
ncbi:MAG: hypothetical protein HKN58_11755 [Xanthomonadales bacterium]|nr:hypothetical protein [Xanthomonadales bacterium]